MLTSLLPTTSRNSPLGQLAREMDRFFETELSRADAAAPGGIMAARWPGLNAWRQGEEFFVEAELPGFSLDDIEVDLAGDTLTIRGQRSWGTPEGASPIRVERTVRRFERSFRLPVQIDADGIDATLTNGVLRVRLPMAESARPRRVRVRALESGNAGSAGLPASSQQRESGNTERREPEHSGV